jgi:hypothetical protein
MMTLITSKLYFLFPRCIQALFSPLLQVSVLESLPGAERRHVLTVRRALPRTHAHDVLKEVRTCACAREGWAAAAGNASDPLV